MQLLLVILLFSGECFAQFDRPWRVYAVPFSHTDVGYTATVPEVIAAHERYLDSVIVWVNRTAVNEEGIKFKWTIEIPWVLEYYMRDRSASRVESLMTLIRNGSIEIGAMHFGLQTDLCGNEELVRSLSYAQELRQSYGVQIRTAMLNDTPGFTWSLAQLLPKGDIPYLSVAMNSFFCDFYKTTTIPFLFYHQAQSGDRVLVWRCIDSLWAYLEGGITLGIYGGYSNFNGKLSTLLTKLAQRGYPYNEVFINCATGDNGSPSLAIVDNVQQWNSTHVNEKVIIATASQFFDTVSTKYAAEIPVLSGDAPNWWAWMFSPSASGVFAQSRRAQVLLPAAEELCSMASLWQPGYLYPDASFRGAYINNLLVEDHNLGTSSGSAVGNAEFWGRKVGWVTAAYDTAAHAMAAAVQSLGGQIRTNASPAVAVFNPTAWPRGGVVTLSLLDPPISLLGAFDVIDERTGAPVPLQRLSAAAVAFMATDIPPTGYRCFTLASRGGTLPEQAGLTNLTLENDFYRLQVDGPTGSLRSIVDKAIGEEIVSSDHMFDLYRFNSTGVPGPLTVAASDSGPVLQRIVLTGNAPGSSSYETTVTLVAGEKRIDCQTAFTRLTPSSSNAEDIDFDFHFAVTSPALWYEIPFGSLPIFSSELSGFRTNHYAPQHWMYTSRDGGSKGVILATAESPIIAANGGIFNGAMRLLTQYNNASTAYRAGTGPQQMLFSVTSGTNGFQPDEAAKFAYGAISPLPAIVLPAGQSGTLPDSAYSLLSVLPARLQLSTIKKAADGQGIIVRLFNPANETITAQLTFGGQLQAVTETSLLEVNKTPLGSSGNSLTVNFAPYEVKTIRAVLSPVLDVPMVETEPVTWELGQCYPNPFNPATMINYTIGQVKDYPEGTPIRGGTMGGGDLGRNVQVQLSVYDILGRQVAVLVNEAQRPGRYQVRFNGANLASGVYFYRLQAGSFMQVKRMMLLK